ncbi:MAG: DNA mismatch repair endonuclease MutL [Clostridia bacterium]|nr:DNA mismatch repair endonuclease MutL [Clostridia bacterium]
MGNIILLDDLTINKIAAGEVIERPASVVKEVVENSIDAGANNISVEIKNGGISYIRITDNGKGIAPDDIEIAFERHATSKIRKAEDLETVQSMGFRGEALASIAAIARVEVITKTEDSNIGYRMIVEGGKVLLKEEIGCPKGTTITIENLFYNTPVRYKFLKKDFTESGYIEDAITRIAVVNPNIAIKLTNTGKTVIQTSGNGNVKDVIYGIFGKDIAENIIDVDYSFEDMNIRGVIGKPNIARSNRSNQLFFVNKRYVKDKTLTSAAEQAFKGKLSIGKYAFLILNVEIDPHKLDVNVHPAKLEVRFQEENKVFQLVYHAISEALEIANVMRNSKKENYIDEIEKIENRLFEGTAPTKERSESRGIGGFIKSILGGSKNEFVTNDKNVVEQVYNDKFQNSPNDGQSEIDGKDNSIGVDYSLGSLAKNTQNSSKLEEKLENYNTESKNEKLENYNTVSKEEKLENYNVVGKDEKLENYNTVSENEKLENANTLGKNIEPNEELPQKEEKTETKSPENTGSEVKASSNLERLVRELDANLKKMNMKTVDFGVNKNTEDNLENLEVNNGKNINVIDDRNVADDKYTLDDTIPKFTSDATISKEKEESKFTLEKVQQENLLNNQIVQKNSKSEYTEQIPTTNYQTKQQNSVNQQTPFNFAKSYQTQESTYTSSNFQTSNLNTKNETNSTEKESELNFEEMYEKMFGTNISKRNRSEEEKNGYIAKQDDLRTVENVSLFTNNAFYTKPVYKYIGIAFGENIVMEYEKELYILNQRAANERIIYEKVRSNYYNETSKDSQLMLLPDIINLTDKQMGIVEDAFQVFKKAGFDIEEFGDNTIKLNAVPSMCIDLDTKQLFISILEEINTVARTSKEEIEDKFMATVASKVATKIKLISNEQEADNLMQQLLWLPKPFVSPNGTPTAIRISKAEIEKKFSRR